MLWRDGSALEAAWNILLNVEMFDFHHRWNHEVRVIVYEIVLSSIVLTFVTLSYWIDAWPDFLLLHITALPEAHWYKLKLLGITKGDSYML